MHFVSTPYFQDSWSRDIIGKKNNRPNTSCRSFPGPNLGYQLCIFASNSSFFTAKSSVACHVGNDTEIACGISGIRCPIGGGKLREEVKEVRLRPEEEVVFSGSLLWLIDAMFNSVCCLCWRIGNSRETINPKDGSLWGERHKPNPCQLPNQGLNGECDIFIHVLVVPNT